MPGEEPSRKPGREPLRRVPRLWDLLLTLVLSLVINLLWDRIGVEWSDGAWIRIIVVLALLAVIAWVWRNSPRALLTGTAAVLAGALIAQLIVFRSEPAEDACGRRPADDAVDVLVVWEDAELADFCAVVADYGSEVEVTSVGEDIGAAVDERLAGDDPPDVAMVPQPSLVRRYAADGALCPVAPDVADRFPRQWNELVTVQEHASGQDQVYGAVVKGAHKSLFWYDLDALGAEDPGRWTWDDLVRWVDRSVDSPTADAPLAVPAGSRWPLTDWFENQLAGTDPELYERLATGERVDWRDPAIRQALTDMARLWRRTGVLAGGPEGAAATTWSELAGQVFEGRAALAFGPSFVAGPADDLPRSQRLWVANFPELDGGRPLIVGGDFAVVPSRSGRCTGPGAGQAFVRWLTARDAIDRWSRHDSGFLTPNSESPYAGDERVLRGDWEDVRILLTALIRPGPDERLHFDLSDDQFAVANEGDARGSWDVLHAFFTDVTSRDPGDLDCALDRAVDGLAAEYTGDPPPEPAC